ncbi:uncharacterized protein LOC119370628 [Jatropha curcas]|uniref:uncharacterized protein LOC119370628 n=1 Tax=Jatropha curcas TaxID=180498 RepID=UPI0018958F65|nr:uncharacterized protein LOC119370628 [Jatropha curcas]
MPGQPIKEWQQPSFTTLFTERWKCMCMIWWLSRKQPKNIRLHLRSSSLDFESIMFFLRLRKYNLKLNPAKCLFGATSGVFLGHMVRRKGIEIDPSKAKAILEMPAPRTEKEVRGFLGRLQYISRFINQLADTCGPIFKLLRKGVAVKWNEDCQAAFDQVKQYLLSPPVLQPPRLGKPLLLYLSVTEEAMGAILAQQAEDTRIENAVYYLSKRMLEYELKYNKIEKLCLALAEALLHQLAELPRRPNAEVEFPDEDLLSLEGEVWEMYRWSFKPTMENGIGVVFKLLVGEFTSQSQSKLDFDCTTTKASMKLAQGFRSGPGKRIKILGFSEIQPDSLLKLYREMEIKEERLVPYLRRLDEGEIKIIRPRPLTVQLQKQPAHIMNLVDDKPWYWDIQNYLQNGAYPEGSTKTDQRILRQLASGYFLTGGILYKKSWNGLHLRCVDEGEAQTIMDSLHNGQSGPHMHGIALARNMNLGYYCRPYCRFAEARAEVATMSGFAKLQRQASRFSLNPITSPWPFATWALDVIGKIHQKGFQMAINSFWFVRYQHPLSDEPPFEIHHAFEIITDNGSHFQSEFSDLLKQKKIQHHKPSPYRPQTNGAVEAANKAIKVILQKTIQKHRAWHEQLPNALWDTGLQSEHLLGQPRIP